MERYILHIVIILIVLYYQFKHYLKNKSERKKLLTMFDETEKDNFKLDIVLNKKDIRDKIKNEYLFNILDDISDYIDKNEIKDLNVIKSIVEREFNAINNSVLLGIPKPLYVGLMGTFGGVIIGLWPAFWGKFTFDNPWAINNFIGGVGIAMLASLCGLYLTFRGNLKYKDTISKVENKKNRFLNTLESVLFPAVADNTIQIIYKLKDVLNEFNRNLNDNAKVIFEENSTLINDLKNLLTKLDKLDLSKFLHGNAEIFDQFIQNLDKFDKVNKYIDKMSYMIEDTQSLSDKLNKILSRVANFEDSLNSLATQIKADNTVIANFEQLYSLFKKQSNILEAILSDVNVNLDNVLQDYTQKTKDRFDGYINYLNSLSQRFQSNYEQTLALIEKNIKEIAQKFYSQLHDSLNELASKSLWNNLEHLSILPIIQAYLLKLQNLLKFDEVIGNQDELNNKIEAINYKLNELIELKQLPAIVNEITKLNQIVENNSKQQNEFYIKLEQQNEVIIKQLIANELAKIKEILDTNYKNQSEFNEKLLKQNEMIIKQLMLLNDNLSGKGKSLRGNSLTVLNENIIHLGNVLEYSWLHPIKYLAYLIKKVFNISNKVVEVNNDNNNGKSKDEQIKLSNKKDVAEKVAEPKNEEKN